MKKTFLYVISAVFGICAAIAIHISFMVVEAKGVNMLPTIEPEENVLVCIADKNVEVGDVVACKKSFYSLDGEGCIIFRRVKDIEDEKLILICDMQLTQEEELSISKDDILGKVVLEKIS